MPRQRQINKVALGICMALMGLSAAVLLIHHFSPVAPSLLFSAKVTLLLAGLVFVFTSLLNLAFGRERTTEILRNLTISGVTLILLLPVAEYTMRFLYRDVMSTRDNSGYFSDRGYKRTVRLNSLGYREKEFEKKKADGVYRIAVIGDSFAFGQGIKEQDRFSDLIAQNLNAGADGKFEILNFGLPGKEMSDNLKTLTGTVLDTHPDFVLLQWFVNDFEGPDKRSRRHPLPLIPNRYISLQLRRHSALYYLVNDLWQEVQIEVGLADNYIEYMKQHFSDENKPGSQKFQADLSRFIRICKEQHIGVAVVLFPMVTEDFNQNYPFAFLHEQVIKICERENCPYLDLRAAYAAFKNPRSLWANRLDSHPGTLANRVAADKLMSVFGDIWRAGKKQASS
jgi:hypothetical protein